jgi:hypothetical protein
MAGCNKQFNKCVQEMGWFGLMTPIFRVVLAGAGITAFTLDKDA